MSSIPGTPLTPITSPDYPDASSPEGVRRLNDPVLQSSTEAVVGEGMEPPLEKAETLKQRAAGSLNKSEQAVRRYVAENPCKAALLAAGAGALVMMLAGSQARKYRKAIPWHRLPLAYRAGLKRI